jgi:hypothetical protein
MSAQNDFEVALLAMTTLQRILEPSGGELVGWRDQPREKLREFLRSAANTQWVLGLASEDIIGEVAIALPRGA